MSFSLRTFLLGALSGGFGLKLIDYTIAWIKERREQRSHKTAHEKDRPRFRIDVVIVPTSHALVPAAIVKILSLGSLPLTINKGEVFIEASHYTERVESYKIGKREISPIHPIEFTFSLPQKLVNPSGIGPPFIKLVCQFSYGDDGEEYKE